MVKIALPALLLLSSTLAFVPEVKARPGSITCDAITNSTLTIHDRVARFQPANLGADLSGFSKRELLAISKLQKVAHIMDKLYLRQAWSKNEELRKCLVKKNDKDLLQLFDLFKGPWDRIADNEPFIQGVPGHLTNANFYPEDMTKEEFETWVATLSPADQKKAKGFYHVVRRNNQKKLTLVPYSKEYRDLLIPASILMQEAALLVKDASLRKFLSLRGKSFITNEYLESELAWLKISPESKLEVTVGPYETYTDGLNSYKSAFEMFIHARDFESSSLLQKFEDSLADVEAQLPIPENYRNKNLKATPIVVVNELYNGGDVAVPMTAAYNLPNDEDAIAQGGSKLVIIKNVQEQKFAHTLKPIAETVIAEDQLKNVNFDAFFNHVLLHEVSHSNGPHLTVGGSPVPIRSKLQELHSTLEEAKADITGLFAAKYLSGKGLFPNITMESFYTTFLASSFRSIRFGLNEAHGRGQAAQLNYLIEKGGFKYDATADKFSVDFTKIEESVSSLVKEIMTIQGDGDKAKATTFLNTYGVIKDHTAKALEKLKSVPTDIQPIWGLDKK
ncbi:hypothetical protein K493DRAFT_312274 [Basidiobolus meristosporus CBS 931.73]|uniref:MutT/nudix family protein n=1 Tax=Basidiobolus meristosporus CBS 931.73 TaxID=1314790 RepID=A0A1Y1YUW7_9FUNG|nr:hypothetical protein K493DRAFT_312274 [Basidiobolus meristosporus CBS 931.73]|eukprot:ORY01756.1 hypothetical protein K493DRAFT_312274 [Basidiobolus meristosporus CBS 931.73]